MSNKRYIVESILRLSNVFKDIWEKEFLKKENITPLQFNILWVVLEEKAKTIQDIKKFLIVSSASLSQTLNRMEEKKLIKRVYGKWDKRYVYIQLTKLGEEKYRRLLRQYKSIIDEKMFFLSAQEQQILRWLLDKIEKHLTSNNNQWKK